MIGGSSAAAACGLDPFKSPAQLWLELTGRVQRPEAGEAAEWGQRLEPMIAEAVRDRGYKVWGSPGDIESTDHEWMRGTPDGFVRNNTGRGLLEIKTAGLRMARLWADGQVPIPYTIQCHHYMVLTGCQWALVACLIGGQRLVLEEIPFNAELAETMMELEERFVGYVKSDTPPPVDGSAGSEAMLRILYPEAKGDPVHLSREQLTMVETYRVEREALKAREDRLDTLGQEIKSLMGEAPVAMFDGSPVVRWSTVEPKSRKVKSKQLAEQHPDVFEECSYLPNPYRRFQVL